MTHLSGRRFMNCQHCALTELQKWALRFSFWVLAKSHDKFSAQKQLCPTTIEIQPLWPLSTLALKLSDDPMTNHSPKPAADAVQKPAFNLVIECDDYAADISNLHENAFGPGRFTRAAFRLREQGPFDQSLSFMALDEQTHALLGSARLTWVKTSQSKSCGLLLGPLAIQPNVQNKGIGRALVRQCIQAATDTHAQFVMLVGDQPYYGPLGFETAPIGQVSMPGPVDKNRLLACPLGSFEIGAMSGLVCHADLLRD